MCINKNFKPCTADNNNFFKLHATDNNKNFKLNTENIIITF